MAVLLAGCSAETLPTRIEAIVIEVTGSEYNWYFRYPGPDGELGTADDRSSTQHLYLPDNAAVRLDLRSRDYVYSLAIPQLGLKEIAVPDLEFDLQFSTADGNTWDLRGDQFCGYAHKTLLGKIFIRDQSVEAFYSWDEQ